MGLTLPSSSNQSEILELAIAKHARFNKTFNSNFKYTLLYPNSSEMKSTLPESDKPFSLEKYKELGEPYSIISLFVC